ncbi:MULTISPECIES: hypothetical protein [Xanthomonas]|uniref:hypothetical protein n=1 Tax=Xanthomonas TaxID=338 RepID=UPI000A9A789E|nr:MULTISPECIES: hypothetical protein [Xanthomonas]MEA9749387.1 hypothetical protein [Xanthomonas campestris pv. raphani]
MELLLRVIDKFWIANPMACAIFVLALASFVVIWKALNVAGSALRKKGDDE